METPVETSSHKEIATLRDRVRRLMDAQRSDRDFARDIILALIANRDLVCHWLSHARGGMTDAQVAAFEDAYIRARAERVGRPFVERAEWLVGLIGYAATKDVVEATGMPENWADMGSNRKLPNKPARGKRVPASAK